MIKEITALGLDPAQLIQAGIRRDVVEVCCRDLGLPIPKAQETAILAEPIVIPDSPPASNRQVHVSPLANEKKIDSKVLPSKPLAWPFHLLSNNANALLQNASKGKPAGRLAQKLKEIETKRKRDTGQKNVIDSGSSSLASVKKQKNTITSSASTSHQGKAGKESNVPSSPMEAMRLAALASMKRKKAAEETQSVVDAGNLKEVNASTSNKPISAETDTTSTKNEIPTGPKASRPIYHDIDAPELQVSHDEVADDLFGSSELSFSVDCSTASADPRQRTRSKMSYADEYSWDVDAPTGEVDLEAPLPSLQTSAGPLLFASREMSKSSSGQKKRPVAADLIEMSGNSSYPLTSRFKPFLSSANWQKVVLDCSDDDDEEEGNDGDEQNRKASTALIAHIWKQMNGSDNDSESRIGSPRFAHSLPVPVDSTMKSRSETGTPLSKSPSDADLILSRKEQEIREMSARIQEMERRLGQAPTDPQLVVKAAEKVVEEKLSFKRANSKAVGSSSTVGCRLLSNKEAGMIDGLWAYLPSLLHPHSIRQRR